MSPTNPLLYPPKLSIVFTGGGSAGHVTPNLALIDYLQSLAAIDIYYIGSETGIEKQLLAHTQIPYYAINTGKLRRYFSWRSLLIPWQVISGIMQSFVLCRRLKPQLVFSKGGFVAFPVVVAAWLNRIPVIIHESDLLPGLANRLSFFFASRICVAFPETIDYLKDKAKVVVTGTPIRSFLICGQAQEGLSYCRFNNEKPVLLVIGGSLGSENINRTIRRLLQRLLSTFQVVHLCGAGKTDAHFEARAGYRQFDYLDTALADVMACADVVVSRSGATAVAELLALRKPHVLLPLSSQASRGDQIANAVYCAKKGLSYVIYPEEMNDNRLLTTIEACYRNRVTIQETLSRFSQLNSSQLIHLQLQALLYHSTGSA